MKKPAFTILLAMSVFTFFGLVRNAHALPVGAEAPKVGGVDQDGKPLALSDYYAKGPVLVYFYPKAGTPGCTAEACSLRDAFTDLSKEGLQVVGVSMDTPQAQKSFQEQNHLPFPLLADKDGAVAKAFEVPTTMGMAKRQSFLIKDGKIAWADLSASTAQQAADVKKALAVAK